MRRSSVFEGLSWRWRSLIHVEMSVRRGERLSTAECHHHSSDLSSNVSGWLHSDVYWEEKGADYWPVWTSSATWSLVDMKQISENMKQSQQTQSGTFTQFLRKVRIQQTVLPYTKQSWLHRLYWVNDIKIHKTSESSEWHKPLVTRFTLSCLLHVWVSESECPSRGAGNASKAAGRRNNAILQ